ncbi:MAG: sulfite exporter TauE/SafE family protein [Xanthobacteraceae bacterium]|uniref:sulfite exporter TauE/SafE family protein n=1 Tax=Pseudolabrys sp. TaxID=1960880 RepID=UPI003D0E915F
MQIYLPIADLPVNMFLILGMGLAVGFISGMFGIGGGFLMTPLLIFVGISPAVAVASVASHIAASSCSGAINYWRRRTIDISLALMLLIGGFTGTAGGVWLFSKLRALDQLDLVIGLSYVTLLSVVGGLMIHESVRAILRARKGQPAVPRRPGSHAWFHGLPYKMRFKRSKIYVSVIPVLVIGFIIGFIGAIMGIGGGFLLVPMLIYLLRVPTSTVIGTSMVLTLVTMASATVLHAATNHLVDAVLALILMVGGVVGAQFGARTGQKMSGERLRLMLGALVFAVGLRFAYELVVQPDALYSIRLVSGGP